VKLISYQKFADLLHFHPHCGEHVLDLCKFQSSQKAAIYAQSVDSSNAFKKPSAFDCICIHNKEIIFLKPAAAALATSFNALRYRYQWVFQQSLQKLRRLLRSGQRISLQLQAWIYWNNMCNKWVNVFDKKDLPVRIACRKRSLKPSRLKFWIQKNALCIHRRSYVEKTSPMFPPSFSDDGDVIFHDPSHFSLQGLYLKRFHQPKCCLSRFV